MKALSIKQPWANLISSGQKTIETRTWTTDYRGTLLIVSSRLPKIEPAGCALAIVELVDCRPMRQDDEPAARCPLYPNAFAWILRNVRQIAPFPVRGQMRLYEVHCPPPLLLPPPPPLEAQPTYRFE